MGLTYLIIERMKKYILTALLIFPFMSHAFNLTKAYDSALEYNADYLGQIASNSAGQESQIQARSKLLPQISATGSFSEAYLNTQNNTSFYHQPTVTGQFSQVAFDFGKFSGYTKGKYQTKVSDLQLENAKEQLIVNVAQAYFDVLYATDVLNSIRITKSALLKQLNQAQKSFNAGTVSIADVNDAQSGHDSAVAQEIQAENDLINKQNIFRNLVGLDPSDIGRLVDGIHLQTPTPTTAEAWGAIAKSGNINVKIAEVQLDMAKVDMNIAISGHLPNLNAVGNYQYQGVSNVDSNNSSVNSLESIPGTPLSSYTLGSAGLQLNLPIYSGGAVSSQVRQASANYKQSQQQLISVERQTDQNIQNAFWQVQNGVSIVKAQTQSLKSAKLKLDSDRLGYQEGVRNSIDLVNSEKNYAAAIQNYNNARYMYMTYRLQLRYLAGNLDKTYLKEIDLDIK